MMVDLYKQASKQIPEVVSLPPKWLNMYGDFITKNASAVSQIESALRSLTYIIPGKPNELDLCGSPRTYSVQVDFESRSWRQNLVSPNEHGIKAKLAHHVVTSSAQRSSAAVPLS